MQDNFKCSPSCQERMVGVEGLIWDLDNTLYRLDEVMIDAFNLGFARAAIESGVDLRLGEAAKLARQSYEEHGFGGHVFIEEYGLTRKDLHFRYHGYLDEEIIEKSLEMRSLFLQLSFKHVLITHSARPWAQKVLAHLGLSDWFPSESILALEDYNFEFKHESEASFEAAIAKVGLPQNKLIFIDDTVRNLEIPSKMGLLTCYINHGREADDLPAYVDISANSTVTLLNMLKDVQKNDRRERIKSARLSS